MAWPSLISILYLLGVCCQNCTCLDPLVLLVVTRCMRNLALSDLMHLNSVLNAILDQTMSMYLSVWPNLKSVLCLFRLCYSNRPDWLGLQFITLSSLLLYNSTNLTTNSLTSAQYQQPQCRTVSQWEEHSTRINRLRVTDITDGNQQEAGELCRKLSMMHGFTLYTFSINVSGKTP